MAKAKFDRTKPHCNIGTNVTMGLCSVKFSFSHYLSPP